MDAGAFLVGLLRICELQEGSSTSRTPGGGWEDSAFNASPKTRYCSADYSCIST